MRFEPEDDRWILGLAGYAGHHPPADPDGFLAVARSIARPHVYAAIADVGPLDDIRTHRLPANLRRRMSGCGPSRPGWWSSAMRSAPSTRSTGRA